MVKILAIDLESCSLSYADLIIGISIHSAYSLSTDSGFVKKLLVVRELTHQAEEEVLSEFLSILEKNKGVVLTAYNLLGFDLPILPLVS